MELLKKKVEKGSCFPYGLVTQFLNFDDILAITKLLKENRYSQKRNTRKCMLAFGAFLTPKEVEKSLAKLKETEAKVLVKLQLDFQLKNTERRTREVNFGAFEKALDEKVMQIMNKRNSPASEAKRNVMKFRKKMEVSYQSAYKTAAHGKNCNLFILKIN